MVTYWSDFLNHFIEMGAAQKMHCRSLFTMFSYRAATLVQLLCLDCPQCDHRLRQTDRWQTTKRTIDVHWLQQQQQQQQKTNHSNKLLIWYRLDCLYPFIVASMSMFGQWKPKDKKKENKKTFTTNCNQLIIDSRITLIRIDLFYINTKRFFLAKRIWNVYISFVHKLKERM